MPSSRLVLTVLVAGPLACDPGPGADAPADIAAPNALDAEVDLPEAPIDLGEATEIDLGDLGFTPLSLELGDFDGDGAIDLLITGVDGSVVTSATLRGLGDGTFEAPFDNGMSGCSAYPVVGRLSDDLRDDVVIAGCGTQFLTVLAADADGVFSRWSTWPRVTGTGPRSVVVQDFEGDGDHDLIALTVGTGLNGRASLQLFESNGGTGFWGGATEDLGPVAQSGFDPNRLVAGDLDGDGVLDPILTDQGHDVARLLGGPTGFGFARELGVGLDVWSSIAADLDGDGAAEIIATSNAESTAQVLLNDGGGDFEAGDVIPLAHGPYDADAADVDGDGAIDLVTVDDSERRVRWLRGDGAGGLGDPQERALPSGAIRIHAADLDGDGFDDLVAATFAAHSVSVLLSGG